MSAQFQFGRDGEDFLSVRIFGRMHDADDYWDGNWLACAASGQLGGFRVDSALSLRAEEIAWFIGDVKAMQKTLRGKAILETMEEWIALEMAITGGGQLEVEGRLRDRLGRGNELMFVVDGLDQTDLTPLIQGLDDVRASFPVLGRP